jgi:hypothetical protein
MENLVGSRIYPGWIPENAIMPAVAFLVISDTNHHDISVAFPRMQFSVFSPRYLEAKEIADVIKKSLKRFKGDMGGTPVIQIVFENGYETFENASRIYHVVLDFKIIYWE